MTATRMTTAGWTGLGLGLGIRMWVVSVVVTALLIGVGARPALARARARAAVTVAGVGAGAGARPSQSGAPRRKRAPAPAPAARKSRAGKPRAPGKDPTDGREETAERTGGSAAERDEVATETDSARGSPTPTASPRRAGDEAEGGSSLAGPTAPGKPAKTTVYTFGAMDVEGKLKTPQLLYFLNRVKLELDMSAPDERSFMKELARTADDPNL